MTDRVWNIVLVVLVALAASGMIAIISLIGMGLTGGMMSCGVGMAGGWLVGFLLIAAIAGAAILFLRRRPQH
ncbi:MAG TPA: hypothetical protein VJZ77_04520 [Blastocatellia bacterium]|nr:hypothetical protein [Blastocatellia bacterium]